MLHYDLASSAQSRDILARSLSVSRTALHRSRNNAESCTGHDHENLLRENEALKREWQICEELLAGSQSDNERKHTQIESLRHYVKTLESVLDDTLGSRWRIDHDVSQSQPASVPVIDASTPLPKPASSLRQSTSIMFSGKRASRLTAHVPSGAGRGPLAELSETTSEADSTPTGAMRRLQDSTGLNASSLLTTKTNVPPCKHAAPSTADESGPSHEPTLRDIIGLLNRLSASMSGPKPSAVHEALNPAQPMFDQLAAMEKDCKRRETGLKGMIEEARRHTA